MRILPKASLVFGAALGAVCGSLHLALAVPAVGPREHSPLTLALNPQPEPPGFWDVKRNKLIPLNLLPPGPCRIKTYFLKNMEFCEAHLLTKNQGM